MFYRQVLKYLNSAKSDPVNLESIEDFKAKHSLQIENEMIELKQQAKLNSKNQKSNVTFFI